jgi:phosphate transport system substrate-binding protein
VKVSLVTRAIGVGAVAAVALSACGSNSNGSNSSANGGTGGKSIQGSGSTFQAALEQQWSSQFSGGQVSYNPVGSSTGQQQFADGNTDFAGTDVTIDPTLKDKINSRCGGTALTLPVTAGGVAIIYNLPGITTLKLDAPTIAKIFQGEISKWNDPTIASQNQGVSLPSTAISPVHRSDGSGTTGVLSAYLDSQAKSVWKLGSNTTLTWPKGSGQAAAGSDGVTQAVAQTTGGITYAEQSYVKGSLKAADVKSAGGSYVKLSPDTVSTSIGDGFTVTGTGGDLSGTLDFGKMTGYPLSTVSYVVVCQKYSDAKVGSTVKAYFKYAVSDGQQFASQLAFAPLPQSLVTKVESSLGSIS